MRFVSDRASAMIDRVLAAKTNDFLQLTLAAGLSPGSDFHHTLMRGVDFAECDLDTFDFSGTVFDSCGFEGTRITGSRFDGAVFHNCSLEDAADYALWAAHQTPRRGTARDDRTPSRSGSTAVPVAEPVDTSERGAAASGKNQRQMEAWQVRCLCELTNFAGISRKLGTHAASRVMLDLSRTIGDAMPMRHRVAASQSMIDIKFACSTPDAAKANLESMCASLPRKVSINGERCKLNLRLGAATLPSEEEADERLRETAERALDRAEEGGPVVLIDLSRELPFDPLDLLVDLPRAMAKDELRLLYQPKMHVGRQQVVGVEALMRWMHPKRGSISTVDFIPIVEEAGKIADLTLWALRHAIEDQEYLQVDGHDVSVFLNLSGTLLSDVTFIEQACTLVDASSAKIGFEVTETAVIRDPERALRHLRMLADHGVSIAVDNYGTGLSSLAYLKQLPASELKIDKMFVGQLTSSNLYPLIVRSTIDLAHALDMEVTAEGVETQATLALLTVMGCDMIQGYLISRPLDFGALRSFLAEHQHVQMKSEQVSFTWPKSFWKRA